MKSQRKTDEMWTQYIVRRLQEEGHENLENFFNYGRWKINFEQGENRVGYPQELTGDVGISRRIANNNCLEVVVNRYINVEGILTEKTYKEARDYVLAENIFIQDIDGTDDILFTFFDEGVVAIDTCIQEASQVEHFPESIKKYIGVKFNEYDSLQIVEDILTGIKEIGVNPEVKPSPWEQNNDPRYF